MKKILAFAGSNSSKSINHQLVEYTASLIDNCEVKLFDIRAWNIPLYSLDMDPDETPSPITELIKQIEEHDGFILSSPEHNGSLSAFLKNIIDWLSRRSKNVFADKPMLLMSASPGKGGGANNRKQLEQILPYQGAKISATFSLPSFYESMKEGKLEGELLDELNSAVKSFTSHL